MFTRRLHSEGFCSLLLLKRLQKLNTKYSSSASQKSYQVDPKCFELLDRDMKKRIFNTVLWENDSDVSYMKRRNVTIEKYKREKFKLSTQGAETPTPLTLKLLEEVDANTMDVGAVTFGKTYESVEEKPPQYPFAKEGETSGQCFSESGNRSLRANNRIRSDALLALEEKKIKVVNEWMSYYEYYDDVGDESSRFGTSDPNEPVSRVSCGGCGALLHCQDISIPGYLPKELFAGRSLRELKSMICQRCHFLKHFNVALDVSVKPEEYSKIISCIKEKYAIAVIMVDLLDFPCSIWPDMMDIVGTKRPVLIVGNKVDLIPGDQSGYLKHLEETLQLYVEKMGVAKANIKSVCLISARTGFGVEDLITKLQDLWESKHRQDVYLLGCTNVGKSTLFNRLLQSDFCKTQARDLVQRATTSLWPGTTLNLLKFPILRPDGWRLALRRKRLLAANRILKQENQLKQQQLKRHRMYHMPSFLQFVGKTFYDTELQENQDTFCIKEGKPKMGIWERHNDYVHGRWCFDTPGVVHPDQILNILTTEELLKVIPRSPIIPRFFTIKPGKSLLLAGLGRIDFISSSLDRSSRAVVFSSENLPVTIVPTCEVEDVYQKLVGSDLFAVPFGGPRRLADWPGLQSKDQIIKLEGIGWMECCADVVLSSAGWISVCGDEGMEMSFRAWTPFARGIHVREPALLPFAIHFKGKRINQTPTYRTTRADGTVPN